MKELHCHDFQLFPSVASGASYLHFNVLYTINGTLCHDKVIKNRVIMTFQHVRKTRYARFAHSCVLQKRTFYCTIKALCSFGRVFHHFEGLLAVRESCEVRGMEPKVKEFCTYIDRRPQGRK